MSAGEREEVMEYVCPSPANGIVAELAIGDPSIGQVVRIGGPGGIVPMADGALKGGTPEVSGRSPFVAAFAGGNRMAAHQRETGAGMFAHQTGRLPADLGVASLAIHA